jgi:hypothetical protein
MIMATFLGFSRSISDFIFDNFLNSVHFIIFVKKNKEDLLNKRCSHLSFPSISFFCEKSLKVKQQKSQAMLRLHAPEMIFVASKEAERD